MRLCLIAAFLRPMLSVPVSSNKRHGVSVYDDSSVLVGATRSEFRLREWPIQRRSLRRFRYTHSNITKAVPAALPEHIRNANL